MSRGKVFLDTNLLVYTLDQHDPHRRAVARKLLADLVENRLGVISTQVLQEFYVTATRKLGVAPLDAKSLVHSLLHLEVVSITPELVEQAVDCSILNRLSFWDALVVAAAESARCALLLTEDMNAGQVIRGVEIENPFA